MRSRYRGPSVRTFLNNGKIQSHFSILLRGWVGVLRDTSDSCAVWETETGRKTDNFLSASGLACDGVTRMLPALAAWTAGKDNPSTVLVEGGQDIDPREIILRAVTAGTNPEHRDFWGWASASNLDQRQIEASNVALTLWLARDWFFEACGDRTRKNASEWLAAANVFDRFYNNRAMFSALTHACCLALSDHGMHGSFEDLTKRLRFSNRFISSDGWMWDYEGGGMDYYNFWTNGSHHALVRAILGERAPSESVAGIEALEMRLTDLPRLIDRKGRNILFGRSLAYRWAILGGAVAGQFYDSTAIDPAVVRTLLEAQLDFWSSVGAIDERGVLRGTLTAHGGHGVLSDYINCGHPYWCMQAFLCLGLSGDHAFWNAAVSQDPGLPEIVCRPEIGLILQSVDEGDEVRLYQSANLDHPRNALYQKFVYSSAFPCNCLFDSGCAWDETITLSDNQLTLRKGDGCLIAPSAKELLACEENTLKFRTAYRAGNEWFASVETTLTILPEGYETCHAIVYSQDNAPTSAATFEWVEGGFVLGAEDPTELQESRSKTGLSVFLKSGSGRAEVTGHAGWVSIEVVRTPIPPSGDVANLCYGHSMHANLVASADPRISTLQAHHSAREFTESEGAST